MGEVGVGLQQCEGMCTCDMLSVREMCVSVWVQSRDTHTATGPEEVNIRVDRQ